MISGLLGTKLHPPPIPPKRVPRPFLVQRLNEGLESGRQITLVSAPAGFGKMVCVSEWVMGLESPVTRLQWMPATWPPDCYQDRTFTD